MPVNIDSDKCEGCGDCVETCGVGAIAMEQAKAKADQEVCCDCLACVDACLQKAIAPAE
jgi:pyruvate formate lyase activating enzyme